MVPNQVKKQNGEQIMDMSFYAVVGVLLLTIYGIIQNTK